MQYVPLNIKTNNSLLSSMVKIDELMEKAKKYKYDALTITDDNMYGVMDFYKACLKNNIKPVIGLNIKINKLDIILYATNNFGYKNLIKIQTVNSSNELDFKFLNKHSNDLICIVPYTSLTLYDVLSKIFSKIFIGYKNNDERNKLKNSNNLVYMNEVLYLDKEDGDYLKYLYAIKDGVTIKDVKINKKDNYLLSYEEIKEKYPLDLENNKYIYENCNIELEFKMDLLPVYDCPDNLDSYSYLKKLCKEGLKKIFGDKIYEVYVNRLKYELETINKMGFCNYFLVVYDYVKYAKENNILVGPGRGSAAGSLVSYLLGITIVDPIKHNLLFERFLNPERITMPDIDIDFEDTRREEVINYCIQKYGDKNVLPIISFSTMAAKQAIRDVTRVMGIDIKVVDSICKHIDSRFTLLENYKRNKKLQDFLNISNVNKTIFKVAMKLEGIKRNTSVNASGVIISNKELDEVIPLEKNLDGHYITGYDMTYLEEIGLLKMDFLALKTLSFIKGCLNDIGTNMSFYDIPINDEKALEIFTNVKTSGIFQFETNGMMNFLEKYRPVTFDDVAVALALFRPGPMQNIDLFIDRKYGREKIDYFHNDLINILKPTYGVIVYQEQIMQIANVLAGYSYGEADILRRAMSKKKEEVLLNEREKFISRGIERGYNKEIVEKVYDLILKFASYGFNKAHTVSYAYIAVKMAYLKANYPLSFYKQLLNSSIGSSEKTRDYIYECRANNINIITPNINISSYKYEIKDKSLILPLTIIKNVGDSSAKKIMEEREKEPFKDVFDFISRLYNKGVNQKILENLIDAGALDSFNVNHKTLRENIDLIINYGEIGDYMDDDSLKPELQFQKEYTNQELLFKENEAYGFYMSNHPVMELKRKYQNVIDLDKIEFYFDKNINVITYVEKIKEVTTKDGEKMAFIDGSDEVGKIDIVVFPKLYKKIEKIEEGKIYLIKAKVEKRFASYQLSTFDLKELSLE